jgi:hypothetical protein
MIPLVAGRVLPHFLGPFAAVLWEGEFRKTWIFRKYTRGGKRGGRRMRKGAGGERATRGGGGERHERGEERGATSSSAWRSLVAFAPGTHITLGSRRELIEGQEFPW